jgi:hypothetical protein
MSTYTRFTADDIVPASQTIVTTGLWSGDTGSLEGQASLVIKSAQYNKSGEYYLDVYDNTDADSEVQFSIAYGHVSGGGAPTLAEEETAKLPTQAIYSQYRNLLLGPTDTKFVFDGTPTDHIYVINFQRARMKEKLDIGNWQLPLSGANGTFTFIDNSGELFGATSTGAGRVYHVISGSIASATGTVTASVQTTFGYAYPDLGIIVLNPDTICPTVGFYTSGSSGDLTLSGSSATGSAMDVAQSSPVYTLANLSNLEVAGTLPFAPFTASISDTAWNSQLAAYNTAGLFVAIDKAIKNEDFEFRARSAETISSTHYFVRLRNFEYNYSNNPTFRDQDNNTILIPGFSSDPKVYITTIGLYNDANELLGVAKLSKPVRKSFSEEILLRCRLDF